MKKKKRIILIIIGIIALVLICLASIRVYNSKKYYKVGKDTYEKALADFTNDNFKFETDQKGNYVDYLFNEGKQYYKVLNMDDILKDFSSSNQKNFLTDIDSIKEEKEYYVPLFSENDIANWVNYDIKYSSSFGGKVKFKVITTFCGDAGLEGGTCDEEEYKKIYTKFTIKKENNEWKIDYFKMPVYVAPDIDGDE